MKKIISLMLALITVFSFAVSFTSCDNTVKEYVATEATDLVQEDFGIAVKKGNTALLEKINAVVDEWVADGTMQKYIDYYGALYKGENPDAGDLKTEWDFGSATEEITVYTESGFAPFEFPLNGEIVGVDIAIMSEVAVRNNKKIVINDGLFDLITTNIENSSSDAVGAAGITITESRSERVDFSNIYYSTTLVIVTAKDKPISKVADLSGLKVGVQEGTTGDLVISDAKKEAGYVYETTDENDETVEVVVKIDASTDVRQYKQYSLALADLKAGRIDAILMDKLPAQMMLAVTE